MTLVIVVSGCAAVAKSLGTIVLRIGTDIIVQAGADYIRQILSPDQANGHPTLIVSYTNTAGDGIGTDYAIDGATAITIQNVEGDIHLVGDGNGLAVTVTAGTTATIEIHSAGAGHTGPVAANAKDQAVTIDGIIRWSGQSRRALFDALADLEACRNAAGATTALRGVADGRAHQIAALDKLDVSALPDGGSLRGTLVTALGYSLEADQAFIRWGEHVQQSACRHDGNYDQAASSSRNATATKQQFVGAWNPVARTYGLPEYQETDI